MDTNRRSVLRRVGTGLAAALAGAVAGCSGLEGSGRTPYDVPRTSPGPAAGVGRDGDGEYADAPAPTARAPVYRRWLPAPSELPGVVAGGDLAYDVRFVDLNSMRGRGGAVPAGYARHRRIGRLGRDYLGVDFVSHRRVVRFAGDRAAVVVGRFGPEDVAGALEGTGYAEAGEHRGYRLFAREDDPRAVAVEVATRRTDRRSVVLADPPSADPLAVARAVVDARAGAVERYHEADDAFAALSADVGGPPVATLAGADAGGRAPPGSASLDGVVGAGSAHGFHGSYTYLQEVVRFETPRDPSAVRESVRSALSASPAFEEGQVLDVAVEGRRAVLLAAVADDRFGARTETGPAGPDDGGPSPHPRITWGFDREFGNDELTVTATHEAGDPAPAGALELRTDRAGTIAGFDAEYDVVAPGDALSAKAPVGEERTVVEVAWTPPGGGPSVTLAAHDVGGRTPSRQ